MRMEELQEQNRILNEQYYGNNPCLTNIDKAFQNILDNKGDYTLAQTPEFEKRIKPFLYTIENNLTKLFNYKSVTLMVSSDGSINAWTVPSTAVPITKEANMAEKEKGKYGIQYKKPTMNILVNFNYDIFFAEKMTDRILTAILLHEIGHNFFIESAWLIIADRLCLASVVYNIVIGADMKKPEIMLDYLTQVGMEMIRSIKPLSDLSRKFNKDFNDNETFAPIIRSITGFTNTALSFYSLLKAVFKPFNSNRRSTSLVGTIIGSIFEFVSPQTMSLYKNEEFADNFATSYGYGPEIVASTKIFLDLTTGNYLVDRISNNVKVTNLYLDTLLHYKDLLLSPLETRANMYTEAIDQLNYMKQNLNATDLLPAQRKQMISDLNRMEAEMKKVNERLIPTSDDSLASKGKIMSNINYGVIAATKGGISYNMRKRGYDGKGQWKYLV